MPKAENHPVEKRLVKVQAFAGALFFLFLVMHLCNTLVAPFGAEAYNSVQLLLQKVYQHPALELSLVVVPLLSHAVAGLWLYVLRRRWRVTRPIRYRLQTWAGLFLLLVVIGHALATRGVAYWFDAVPGFQGVAFSLWWMPGYFYPYYFLLFMAGLYHGVTGVQQIRRRMGGSSGTVRVGYSLTGYAIAAVFVTAALLSFGGQLVEIADPRDSDYARQYSEFFGIDLKG